MVLEGHPLAYWRLGETSNVAAADATGNGYDATFFGSPRLGIGGAISRDPNTAVAFAGADDYAVWQPESSLRGAFSAEAWVRPAQTEGILTFLSSRTTSGEFSFDFKLFEQSLYVDIGDGSTWLWSGGVPFRFRADRWYHVAVVAGRRRARLHVNGRRIGRMSYKGTPLVFDPEHAVYIGRNVRYKNEHFTGRIDEVALYNRQLRPWELQVHYVVGRFPRQPQRSIDD